MNLINLCLVKLPVAVGIMGGDRTDNGGRNNNKGRGASTNYGGVRGAIGGAISGTSACINTGNGGGGTGSNSNCGDGNAGGSCNR